MSQQEPWSSRSPARTCPCFPAHAGDATECSVRWTSLSLPPLSNPEQQYIVVYKAFIVSLLCYCATHPYIDCDIYDDVVCVQTHRETPAVSQGWLRGVRSGGSWGASPGSWVTDSMSGESGAATQNSSHQTCLEVNLTRSLLYISYLYTQICICRIRSYSTLPRNDASSGCMFTESA